MHVTQHPDQDNSSTPEDSLITPSLNVSQFSHLSQEINFKIFILSHGHINVPLFLS